MAKKTTGKGALSRDPSSGKAANKTNPTTAATSAAKQAAPKKPKLTRLSPGVYRNSEGQLTNSKGQRTDSRGRPVKVPPKKTAPAPTTPAAPKTPEQQFRDMSPEKQEGEIYDTSGAFYNQVVGNAMKFDPNNPAAGYQQAFTDQLNQSRQTVMDQFERTMGPQFEREQQQFNQRMAEQGIDPNSGAYQQQYKAMMDAQNSQRLNAQAQAFQLGGQYQQQGFEQATTGQMLPFQQLGVAQDPWKLQYASRQEAIQKEKDRQAALQQSRIGAGASVRAAQIGADASMNRANLDAINAGYPQNNSNIRNDIIRGVTAGGTAALLK